MVNSLENYIGGKVLGIKDGILMIGKSSREETNLVFIDISKTKMSLVRTPVPKLDQQMIPLFLNHAINKFNGEKEIPLPPGR